MTQKETEKVSSVEQPQNVLNQTSATNPGGVWRGEWSSPAGAAYTAEINLNDDGAGKISGRIIWTLRRTNNPKKADKIGMTAVEHVQGAFDPATRMLSIGGYRKEDPNDLVILDKYRLTLTEDNQNMSGISFGGRTKGKFNLRRF